MILFTLLDICNSWALAWYPGHWWRCSWSLASHHVVCTFNMQLWTTYYKAEKLNSLILVVYITKQSSLWQYPWLYFSVCDLVKGENVSCTSLHRWWSRLETSILWPDYEDPTVPSHPCTRPWGGAGRGRLTDPSSSHGWLHRSLSSVWRKCGQLSCWSPSVDHSCSRRRDNWQPGDSMIRLIESWGKKGESTTAPSWKLAESTQGCSRISFIMASVSGWRPRKRVSLLEFSCCHVGKSRFRSSEPSLVRPSP